MNHNQLFHAEDLINWQDQDNKKRYKRGQKKRHVIAKTSLPIGQDTVDEKYITSCGDFYMNYDQCLKASYGDFYQCKLFRKQMNYCESSEGYFNNIQQQVIQDYQKVKQERKVQREKNKVIKEQKDKERSIQQEIEMNRREANRIKRQQQQSEK